MSLITKWDGSILTPADPNNERSLILGTFISGKNINTYYPLPSAYADLVPVISRYKVPIKFVGRPDLIANDIYHSPDLWWVVLWSNKIVDPFGRPGVDEVINVIDIQAMKALLK
jgi:hypothetical protein